MFNYTVIKNICTYVDWYGLKMNDIEYIIILFGGIIRNCIHLIFFTDMNKYEFKMSYTKV